VLAEVDAEVAPHNAPEPARVLRRQRLVEVKRLAHRPDALGGRLVPEHHHGRITRNHAHEPEHEQAHPEQKRRGEQKPPHNIDERRHRGLDQPSQTSSKRSSSDESGTEPLTLGFTQYRWISLLKTTSDPSSWNQRTSSGYIFLRAAALAV